MRKIFFDHIYKCGGTSIIKILKTQFSDSEILLLDFKGAASVAMKLHTDYRIIAGHFWFLPKEELPVDHFSITLLRNPIDRIISHYFYIKNNAYSSSAPGFSAIKTNDFHDYIFSQDPSILSIIKNYQTCHYLQLEWNGTDQLDEVKQLELAKKALLNYNLVGVFHQFSEFVDILCYECGWPPAKEIPRENVTSKRPKLSEVDPKIIQRLEELNQLDLALYDYATQLFNEKKRQVLHECIERRHQELNAPSIYLAPSSQPSTTKEEALAPSPPAPLPEDERSFNTPAPADFGNRQLEILTIEVKGDISLGSVLFSSENARIRVIFRAHIDADALTVGIHIHDRFGRLVFGTNSECLGHTLHVRAGGVYFVDYHLRNDLGIGEYTIGAALHLGSSHLSGCFHWRDEVTRFEVVGNIGYHFEGVAKLYPQLRCGVLEGDPVGIQALLSAQDWPRLQQIAIHTPKLTEFNARLHLPEPPQCLSLHQVISVEAEITNTSSQTWGSIGQRPVHLSYHWQAPDGGWLEFNGERTPLPHDLAPGETLRHYLTIKAPPQPGPARLHLTLVQEGVGWFDQHGCPALVLPISVEPGSLTT